MNHPFILHELLEDLEPQPNTKKLDILYVVLITSPLL